MSQIKFGPISDAALSDEMLSSRSFGGNYVFDTAGKGKQKGIGDGGFDEAAEYIGLSHFRFPGGGVAETLFDIANPNAEAALFNRVTGEVFATPKPVTPMNEFLAYAESAGGLVTLVVPTLRYVDAFARGITQEIAVIEQEVKAFVADVMAGPHAHLIEAFEIGNEYVWGGINSPHSAMTAQVYGKIADSFAPLIQEALDDTPHDPLISVQGSAGKQLSYNYAALDQMSEDSLDAIDAVSVHVYRTNVISHRFESGVARDLSHADPWVAATGRDLEVIVSEWNASYGEESNGVKLPVSTAMMRLFNELSAGGMDRGHVWPIIQNTSNELVDHSLDPENIKGDIRLAGELFTQMNRHLDGLYVVDAKDAYYTDADADMDYFLHSYVNGDEGRAVFVVSSLQTTAGTVTLDLSDALASVLGGNAGDDLGYLAPTTTVVTAKGSPLYKNVLGESYEVDAEFIEGDTAGDGIFELLLGAFDVAFIEVVAALRGTPGNDVLEGTIEDDTIEGGDGADFIDGCDGFDLVSFETADGRVQARLEGRAATFGDADGDIYESVEGFVGSTHGDVLIGDRDANVLRGGAGVDRLRGRAGDDTLEGGDQIDVLYGNAGSDVLTGGAGVDRFVFFDDGDSRVGAGARDIIVDFDAEAGETIEISRFDADLTQGLRQQFEFIGQEAFSGQAGELRFQTFEGQMTLVQGDQTGDGMANFEIELTGAVMLTEDNFFI